MGIRREARKLAVQVLYITDILNISAKSAKDIVFDKSLQPLVKEFTEELVEGTLKEIKFINDLILKYTKNWQFDRIAKVDRTILRLGLYELFFEDSIPANVSINEAVELAKYYSTSKSHKFVNGILDAAAKKK